MSQELFNSLIMPMQDSIVLALVAQFIANERNNQVEIAKAAKNEDDERIYSDDWIEQNINFNIFANPSINLDASECPCVCLYFGEGNYDEGQQYPDTNLSESILNIDIFTVGINEFDEDGEITISAEKNADDRLNYLKSQIYHILCSETGFHKGAYGYVSKSVLHGWIRIAQPENKSEAVIILGINMKFALTFQEPTIQLRGNELKEIYIKAKINDELINPIISVIMEDSE